MDPRLPELHLQVCQLLRLRAASIIAASDLLMGDTAALTAETVHKAIALLAADLPSPLRATLFDLGRLLEGNLPTNDIAPPLKIYSPTG